MATPFRLKRSAVASKRPETTNLQLGELALNTYDGHLYTEREGVGLATVTNLTPWYENYGGDSIYYGNSVGIGTTNPTVKLDVVGNVQVSGITSFYNGDVYFVGSSTDTSNNKIHFDQSASGGTFNIQDRLKLQIGTNAIAQLHVNPALGTTVTFNSRLSNNHLHVVSDHFKIKSLTDDEKYLEAEKDGAVKIFHNGNEKLETLERGVGIAGSITVSNDLVVAGVSTFTGAIDANGNLDVDGYTELDDLNVSGVTTTVQLKVGTNPTVGINTILDEDNMASDSATALVTQQSIKAYVDSQVTAQDLDFIGDSGTGSVDLDSQSLDIEGTANEIETLAADQKITIGLPNNVTIGNNLTVTNDVGVIGIGTFGEGIEIKNDTYKLRAGQDLEMQVFHDGTDSIIKDTRDTGSIKIQADNFAVIDKDASQTMIAAGVDGSVSLRHSGNEKFKTLERGVGIAGSITVSNDLSVTGVSTFSADVNVGGATITNPSGTALDFNGSITASDVITAGALLHEGDTNTLVHFSAGDTIELKTGGTSRILINNNGVTLQNSSTFNVNSGRLIVGDSPGISTNRIVLGNSNDLYLYHDSADSYIENSTGILKILGNTIQLGEGADKVGIGTDDPAYMLDVEGAINSSNDVKINGTSVLTSALNEAVAMAIALG